MKIKSTEAETDGQHQRCAILVGVEETDTSGRVYARIRMPGGDENFVPKDELVLRTPPTSETPLALSAEELARLDTWILELAGEARGSRREEAGGASWRFGAKGALIIHPNGWFDFSGDRAGCDAFSLLVHLHENKEDAALEAARQWLAQHAGDGALGRDRGESDRELEDEKVDAEHVAFIRGVWDRAEPIATSSVAMQYYAGRSLDPVAVGADASLRWLPNWRGEEGAVLAAATDTAGELVALQILHLTPGGEKSKIEPVRQIFRGPHDWRQRGAFRIGDATAFKRILTEGVEDAIAGSMAGAGCVLACLGVGNIGRAEIASPALVVVARDDDPPGSAASLALGRGVARLLLQGVEVSITARAGTLHLGAKDLNDLLQVDVARARQFIDSAKGVADRLDKAERESFLEEVSKAPRASYEPNRRAIATTLHWRTGPLEEDRRQRQEARKASEISGPVEVPPWPDPVTDLASVLDAAVAELRRFVIVPRKFLHVMALWAAHSHLLHRDKLGVDYTPRLLFQSPIIRCGKSTALKSVALLSHRARVASIITPAALFRIVDALKATILVDEGERVFRHGHPDLQTLVLSCNDRMTANVPRAEKDKDGRIEVYEFNAFGALALTSIKAPSNGLEDRCITVTMRRAVKAERPETLSTRTRGGLIEIGRQLARWAADLETLPEVPDVEGLFNRVADRWRALFQIAQLAGGKWPEYCREAAMAELAQEEALEAEGGREGDLLADVWRSLYELRRVELHTKELCAALNAMEEAPWSTVRHGQPLNGDYLHKHLGDFIPGKAEDIAPRKFYVGSVQGRGYHEKHFEDAFSRYLGWPLPSEALKAASAGTIPPWVSKKPPSQPSSPSQKPKNKDRSADYNKTGAPSQGVLRPSQRSEVPTPASQQDGHKTGAHSHPVSRNGERDQGVNAGQDGQGGQDRQNPPVQEGVSPEAPRRLRGAKGRGRRADIPTGRDTAKDT